MSSSIPLLIDKENLSHAWSYALLQIVKNNPKKISPLVISITGFQENGEPIENETVRTVLDAALASRGEQSIATVANTIFPYSLWRRSRYERQELFERYIKLLPRAKAIERHKNRRGLYFERLIAFGEDEKPKVNQLNHIISEYQGRPGVRTSMFQASIFDPQKDHSSSALLPFPCLQHVSFVPDAHEGTLTLNAFYATQQLITKAYGNYLGLCRLGTFMAHEMQLTFSRMNCFVGVENLGEIRKDLSTRKKEAISSKFIEPIIQAVHGAFPTSD